MNAVVKKNKFRHMVGKDPYEVPLEDYDVSQRELFQQMTFPGYFKRLREEAPIHFCKDSRFGPYWSITRFQDIVEAETNTELFSSEPSIAILELDGPMPPMFIAMDEPNHGIQRRTVQDVVAPKNLAQLEGLIRERIANILDTLPVGEAFDWVDLVSKELTSQMLATILGFPFEDRRNLTYWSDVATAVPGPDSIISSYQDWGNILGGQCAPAFMQLWEEKKKAPEEFTLISMLAHGESTKNMATENPAEYMGNVRLLVGGGNDTTRNTLSGSVYFMDKNPHEYEKLLADQALLPSFISEVIRYQTPLTHMRRTVTKDTVYKGQKMKKGDKVILWYVSGNRDSDEIDNADEFIIDRKNPRHHISFGFGIHRCMGNRLAEMQLRVTWEEILKRFARVEVLEEPERNYSNFIKGYTNLMVKLHPKAS